MPSWPARDNDSGHTSATFALQTYPTGGDDQPTVPDFQWFEDGAAAHDGGARDGGKTSTTTQGGCGCAVETASAKESGLLWLLALVCVLLWRRRGARSSVAR